MVPPVFNVNSNSFYRTGNGTILLGTNQQIYRSVDTGATWENTTVNIPNVRVTSFSSDPSGYLYAAGGDKGILISTDNGASWVQSTNGLPSSDHPVKVIFAKDENNIFANVASPIYYVSSLAGIYHSTNKGASWMQKNDMTPISGFVLGQNGDLIAGIYEDYNYHPYSSGVYYSSNSGTNWQKYPNQIGFDVRALLITSEGHILSGNYYGGLFLSADDGNSWQEVNTGINNSDITDVYAASSGSIFCSRFSLNYSHGGLYRTKDNGNSWLKLNNGSEDPNIRKFFSDNQGNIYAADNELYRSTDDGDNWQTVISNLGSLFYCITQSPSGTLFAGNYDYGIFRSTDNGLTWQESNAGLTYLTIFDITATDQGTILAGSFEGKIFRSTDDGLNWMQVNSPASSTILSLFKADGNVIYAGTNPDSPSSLFRSYDDGISWEPVNSFEDTKVNHISENSMGHIFAACEYKGVYISQDKGNTWSLISNAGLSDIRVQTITVSHDGYLYAGTWRGSLFRSNASTVDVDYENNFPAEFSLEQNYPNPFNPVTTIQYTIGKACFVKLKIFNALGEEAAVIVNEEKYPGIYEIEFDGRKLSSGIYFYILESGEFRSTKKMIMIK